MPPAPASQQAPPIAVSKPLPAWRVVACSIALPLCVAAVLVAFVGLFVLQDQERKHWLANTAFADAYRALMEWNHMTSALFFNGGIIGSILSYTQLRHHRRGLLLQRVRFLKPEDARQGGKQGKKRR